MTKALYLIGGSGTGKSTVMRSLLSRWQIGPYERLAHRELFGHQLADDSDERSDKGDGRLGLYLGRIREGGYPGTDALSLSVCPIAVDWVSNGGIKPHVSWVFGEGQRLGVAKFLIPLSLVTDLTVVHLSVAGEIAAARRLDRYFEEESDPATRSWKRVGQLAKPNASRATVTTSAKTADACESAGIRVARLDARDSAASIADWISELIALHN